MFNLFKPKPNVILAKTGIHKINSTESLTLHLSGLHCSSCAVNIDLALEDLPGVRSTTSYAKSETKIEYNPNQTTLKKIYSSIQELGYQVN